MRRITPLLLAVAFAACSGGERTSILLVTVDTLRADALACYGNADAVTPRLDRLAAEGVRFTRAKTVCPLTLPTHATLLTGLLPPEHGLRDNDPPLPLPPAELRDYRTLAETFAQGGWSTAAFISASVVAERTGLGQGFGTYDGPAEGVPGALRYAERIGGETAAAAAAWLERAKGPFFAWVHLFDPHAPYAPPPGFSSGAPANSRKAYAEEVTYADSCVGVLLDALARSGAAGRTLVVVTSDHGEGLGDHGESTHGYLLYDTTLRVPLIARWPGRLEAAAERADLVSLADLPHALLGAAGLAEGAGILDGPRSGPVTAETLYGYREMGWAQLFAAEDGSVKLVRGVHDRLFDTAEDPAESNPEERTEPALAAAIERYRELRPRGSGGDPLEELASLPYASGVGRDRLRVIPWEENRKLRPPSPGLADRINEAIAGIGKIDPATVERKLVDLGRTDPGNPKIDFWIGRNAAGAGDHQRAAEAFRRAYEKGLREATVLFLLMKSLLAGGDLESAANVVAVMVPEVTPDTPLMASVAEFHLKTGEPEKALRDVELAGRLARTERERALVSRFRHNLRQGQDK